jgi:hypothetical protein
VLKGHGDGILHKRDLGFVELGVQSAPAVRRSFARLERHLAEVGATGAAITVEPLEHGAELFVGVRNDPHFGPVTVLGLGGTEVESVRAVALRVGDVDGQAARAMLRQTPARVLLRRSRDGRSYDVHAAVDAVAALCSLTTELADLVQSIEVNPLIVHDDGRGVAGVDLVVVTRNMSSPAPAAAYREE